MKLMKWMIIYLGLVTIPGVIFCAALYPHDVPPWAYVALGILWGFTCNFITDKIVEQ